MTAGLLACLDDLAAVRVTTAYHPRPDRPRAALFVGGAWCDLPPDWRGGWLPRARSTLLADVPWIDELLDALPHAPRLDPAPLGLVGPVPPPLVLVVSRRPSVDGQRGVAVWYDGAWELRQVDQALPLGTSIWWRSEDGPPPDGWARTWRVGDDDHGWSRLLRCPARHRT